jgi:hypothetical protein
VTVKKETSDALGAGFRWGVRIIKLHLQPTLMIFCSGFAAFGGVVAVV